MNISYMLIPGLKLIREETKIEKANKIVNAVTKYFDLQSGSVFSRKRNVEIVTARQIAMWFMYQRRIYNKSQAGEYFKKDHTTCIHAINVVRNHMETEPEFLKDIINIENLL